MDLDTFNQISETFEPEIANLRARIEEVIVFEGEEMISKPNWGEINFTSSKPTLIRLFYLVRELKNLPYQLLPSIAAKPIVDRLSRLRRDLENINNFSISEENARSRRDSIELDLKKNVENLYVDSVAWVSFLKTHQTVIGDSFVEIKRSVVEGRELLTKLESTSRLKIEEIGKITEAAREAAASEGSLAFSNDFEVTSSKRRVVSRFWLVGTILLAISTVSVCAYFWYNPIKSADNGVVAQLISTKLALIGILVSSTIWSGRIYKALMHQAEVYHHRAISIKTLKAFIRSVEDPLIRDSIVCEGAKSVFGHISTGYIDQSRDSSDGSVKILEIAKGLLPGGGK